MYAALIVNLAIIAVVAGGIAFTTNPLCILGLFFLRDMTVQLDPAMLMALQDPPEDEDHPMGFTADVK